MLIHKHAMRKFIYSVFEKDILIILETDFQY